MKKIKVAVVMGGRTPEHEISLISGKTVVDSLDRDKYVIFPIVIDPGGKKWQLVSLEIFNGVSDRSLLKDSFKEIVKLKDSKITSAEILAGKVDVVFIAMHGPYGEDGTIQGMFELFGVKYTGPGVLASALGMDKLIFRKVLKSAGIPFPKYAALSRKDNIEKVKKELGKFPYFVKPHDQGSSVGNSIARNNKELVRSLNLAWKYSDIALVDEYISGMEVTCGVIGNERPVALPLVEIVPGKGEFFDYESKYTQNGAEEIVPAGLSKKVTSEVEKMAIAVYKELGCKGFSRVDFIVKDRGKPIVLEINTIPGLTPMSLLPKAAKEAGYSYPKLLDKIINYAIN